LEINFFFSDCKILHLNKKLLQKNLSKIALAEGYSINILNVIFTNDKKILILNRKFLHHNFPTDILTFNNSEGYSVSADLYISLNTLFYNSEKFNVVFKSELYRVVIHGILHLMGFNDKSLQEKKLMRKKEDFYLRLFNQIRS
jgi:probable rRNA maturation factor